MMDSKELWKLNKELNRIGNELFDKGKKLPGPINIELNLGATKIRNTIIKSMRDTPKTGRHYRRGKSGKAHIASSPGNPPAIDYGELVRSIMYDVRDMELEAGVAGGAPYAVFLEGGTYEFSEKHMLASEKMESRPFLGPAVEKHYKEIISNVGNAAFEVIKQGFDKGGIL
ncbi:MAG: hypothetical protein KKF27_21985 [Gammaproteobacteria bacterium]|nr:hypothetical protein [Gammaproteobacteria bacterium]MBU2685922.1 hypothetical protein [Gammaproteobacteria bacterium]